MFGWITWLWRSHPKPALYFVSYSYASRSAGISGHGNAAVSYDAGRIADVTDTDKTRNLLIEDLAERGIITSEDLALVIMYWRRFE